MTYYEHLEVENTATAQEIKKAYFRLVRKYTPERAPERFMQLRQAYELLSTESRRTAYDTFLAKYSGVSKEAAKVIMEADILSVKGLYADAVKSLEQSEYFLHSDVQAAMCRLHLQMEKNGKAVKIAERLVKDNPDNVDYLRLSVIAYTQRGWEKKAHSASKTLDRIDPGNEDNSPAILMGETEQLPFAMGMTIETIESCGKKAPLLCSYVLKNCYWRDQSGIEAIFQELMFDKSSDWNNSVFAAKKLAEHTQDTPTDKREEIKETIKDEIFSGIFNHDDYEPFPYVDQAIRNIQAEDLFEFYGYKIAMAGYSALEAVRSGIPRELTIVSLMCAWIEIGSVDNKLINDYQSELILNELDILEKTDIFIPHIRKFQKNPFSVHGAGFFELVLRSSNHKLESEFRRRVDKVKNIDTRLTLKWLGGNASRTSYDSLGREEPVRVTKIGRNEPCPCGSGKKYKKCCAGL